MTLWEAIRQLKEGQEIRFLLDDVWVCIARLDWGSNGVPFLENCGGSDWLNREVRIIDLPRPVTLYDVLVEGAKRAGIIITCHTCPLAGSDCDPRIDCTGELAKALQSIALAAGFDLKKVVK